MPQLPAKAVCYKQTPAFTDKTLPAGLQHAHTTRAGVWAKIVVASGTIRYHIETTGVVYTLSPKLPGIVVPTVPHHLEVCGPVALVIEFYRLGERSD